MGRRRNKGDGVVKEGEGKTGKSVQQARTIILPLSLPLPLSAPPLSPLETCRLSRRTHKGLQQAVPLLVPLSLPLPLPLPLPLSLSAPLLKPSRRTHKPCRCSLAHYTHKSLHPHNSNPVQITTKNQLPLTDIRTCTDVRKSHSVHGVQPSNTAVIVCVVTV